MNSHLKHLHPYPFERLNQLKAGAVPPAHLKHIPLSIGEPKHPSPEFVKQVMSNSIDKLAQYPTTKGGIELRQTIARWLEKRFNLGTDSIDPDQHVLPVTGTREALFAFTQAVVNNDMDAPVVVSPNPFYQIYEGAAILAGAEPYYLDCVPEQGFIPDLTTVPEAIWQRCQLLQVCTPGNPTGAVMSIEQLQQAIALADKYDFIIASDECYSEVYFDEQTPPPGLLQACEQMGRRDYSRCVVFHSLSKRSNLPGLRSGFIAGDATILKDFLSYRTYHGCAMSLPVQDASAAAWNDEQHVVDSRTMYREKFAAVTDILADVLDFPQPHASFYLWPQTPIDDREFALGLFAQQNVTILPGQYLSRDSATGNPGKNRVRMALVASTEECIEAALRIRQYVQNLSS
ncbi:MAG: succinyldiaminopimelate transaminase [Porticoccaceae bacterium]|mgnify:CR=1 FL=1|jgi:N-succinyldiaminopimelate aminotransferase|nr:succinyldiaminopimelate transaminase [Porticoccaceae bacterium]MDG1485007.1 succinyldiaminopimelate transaminase [Porticoccaceae bacterium]